MSAVLKPSSAVPFEIAPVSPRIGAELRGLRLSPDLAPITFQAIRAALFRHKVLFVRDQHHLDDASQQGFGELWGQIESHPTVPSREGTKIFELDSENGGRANSWHTDVTFALAPPQASILRAVTLPPTGGDTVWANTAASYEELSPALKALADSLWAVHSNDYDYGATRVETDPQGQVRHREVFTSRIFETIHPFVRVHPETGERTLVSGHFLKRFVGHNSQDSQQLFNLFQNHITRLENTVRWRWESGDVAIWDNRATQHYAINDYGDAKRVMRRVTISGEPIRSIDGQRSHTL